MILQLTVYDCTRKNILFIYLFFGLHILLLTVRSIATNTVNETGGTDEIQPFQIVNNSLQIYAFQFFFFFNFTKTALSKKLKTTFEKYMFYEGKHIIRSKMLNVLLVFYRSN